MFPWYVYVLFGVIILCACCAVPIIDYIVDMKKYKETIMENNNEEEKSVLDMLLDGWCDGCDGDPATCYHEGHCLGNKEDNSNVKKENSI